MKRHYTDLAEKRPSPPAWPADEYEDAFAELLANEPPGCKGIVLAY